VTWTTDIQTTSKVEYGTTRSLGSATAEVLARTTSHSVTVSGLAEMTPYYFRAVGNASLAMPVYSGIYCTVTGYQPRDTIVDNNDPGATSTGSWSSSSSAPYYGTNSRYAAASLDETATFEFRPNLPYAGNYEVYVWYVKGSRRTQYASYTTYYNGGSRTEIVNQRDQAGNGFEANVNPENVRITPVGGVPFAAGTGGYVVLSNRTSDAASGIVVVADAVKFRYMPPEQNGPTKPTGLAVSDIQVDRVTLNWNASTDDTGVGVYKVLRDGVLAGGSTGTSFIDENLTPSKSYSYTIVACDIYNNASAASDPASACTLSTPPTPAKISPNEGWNSSPDFVFTAVGGFGEGRIDHYNVAWDQSKTHTWDGSEPSWSTGTLARSVTSSPTGWYLHLLGFNCAGVPNGSVDLGPFSYDSTAPDPPVVYDDGHYTPYRTEFFASWSASDPESDIVGYRYAVGTSSGKTDLLGWTDTSSTHALANLDEQKPGKSIFFSVQARNGGGAWSDAGNSDGITVAHALYSIGEAKSVPKGEPVMLLSPNVVTAVFDGFYYIQGLDRCAGIRVAGSGVIRGNWVQIVGTPEGLDGETLLTSVEPVPTGQIQAVFPKARPILVTGRTLGGCDFPSGHEPNCGQKTTKAWRWVKIGQAPAFRRFDHVAGLNNIGLLVRLTGKVSWVGSDSFYLNDGSAYDDTEGPIYPGVKVLLPSGVNPPQIDSCVSVTGISSCYESSGDLYRLLRVRDAEDVLAF